MSLLLLLLFVHGALAGAGLVDVPDLAALVSRIPKGGGTVVVSPRAYGTLPAGFDVDQYIEVMGDALRDAHGDRAVRPSELGVEPSTLTDHALEAANRGRLASRGVGVFIYLEAQPAVTRVDLYAYVYSTAAPVEPLGCYTWTVTGAAPVEVALSQPSARITSLDDLAPVASVLPPPAPPSAALALNLRPQPGLGSLHLRAWEEGDTIDVDGARTTSKEIFNLAVGAHTIEVGRYGLVARYRVVINAGREVDLTLPTTQRGWQQMARP